MHMLQNLTGDWLVINRWEEILGHLKFVICKQSPWRQELENVPFDCVPLEPGVGSSYHILQV